MDLELQMAQRAFARYAALYRPLPRLEVLTKLTATLQTELARLRRGSADTPLLLCALWDNFRDHCRNLGFDEPAVLSGMKASLFKKAAAALESAGQQKVVFLENGLPAGYLYLEAGRHHRAVELLHAAVSKDPCNARAFGYLGDAYTALGKTETARRCYREAGLLDPLAVDWRQVKDRELQALVRRLEEEGGNEAEAAAAWFPAHARLEGLFGPKLLSALEDLDRAIETYVMVRTVWRSRCLPRDGARLFCLGVVLCENAPLLRLTRTVDLVEVRRDMKEAHPELFGRYMDLLVEKESPC